MDLNKFEGDKYISSQDLKDLLKEAQAERQELIDKLEDADEGRSKSEYFDLLKEVELWDEVHASMLKDLENLCDELPSDDEQCMHDDVIIEYLDEMVADCYSLPKNLPAFISLTIDYDMLKQDYFEFEYFGHTYWVRSC